MFLNKYIWKFIINSSAFLFQNSSPEHKAFCLVFEDCDMLGSHSWCLSLEVSGLTSNISVIGDDDLFHLAEERPAEDFIMNHHIILVGGLNPSEKYEFVSWDDDIPN